MELLIIAILRLLDFAKYIIIAEVVMSWLISFKVINVQNKFVGTIWYYLRRMTEPVMKPIRKILPSMGGLDFSPIVVFFGISLLQRLVVWVGLTYLLQV